MAEAMYGPDGFYARGEPPARHFRTAVHASPAFAAAILALLRRVDAALGHPDPIDLVDVGAGRGELLAAIERLAEPTLRARLRLTAVDLVPRPDDLVGRVRWSADTPELTGLLVANEWLDDIPLDVVEQTADGPRLVLASPSGAESLGPPPTPADLAWLARWWPLRVGDRGEVGTTRDEAWSAAVRNVRRGVAVAIDYAHAVDDRPTAGTMTAYRRGRMVPAVPDGTCNITAHVALDACAAAGADTGATATLVTSQRRALLALGVTGRRPPAELAYTDPARYIEVLAWASSAAELIDPAGLGAFGWLVQAIGVELPLR
jgi:SAM-dependent MidA family methyltransferase